jgi:hypothetical protein
MLYLHNALRDWNTDRFNASLKTELALLPSGSLPLEAGLIQGGMVDDSNISATILSVHETETTIQAKAGIFFTEIVINCGCGDDPMPINAYCEILINVDKTTAEAEFQILPNPTTADHF